jgi:hypothetical protein
MSSHLHARVCVYLRVTRRERRDEGDEREGVRKGERGGEKWKGVRASVCVCVFCEPDRVSAMYVWACVRVCLDMCAGV